MFGRVFCCRCSVVCHGIAVLNSTKAALCNPASCLNSGCRLKLRLRSSHVPNRTPSPSRSPRLLLGRLLQVLGVHWVQREQRLSPSRLPHLQRQQQVLQVHRSCRLQSGGHLRQVERAGLFSAGEGWRGWVWASKETKKFALVGGGEQVGAGGQGCGPLRHLPM